MMPDEPNELRPQRESFLARGVGAALDWGRANPVAAGWIGACLFILVLVYVQALASLVDRGGPADSGDDDGGHGVSEPPDVPPAPIVREPDPAPAPVVDPAPIVPALGPEGSAE